MSKEIKIFQNNLLNWQTKSGRHDLPWQQQPTLYRVWISEIMLQQTQVATVIPYYQKFIQQFPTLADLAKTDIDEVLHLWSGLGYYARARNLHKTALIIATEYQGNFPTEFDQVLNLAGIGRSTAGAILSLADNQVHAILDGNVRRVYARYFMVDGWFGHQQTQKKLWQIAEQFLAKDKPAQFNQALMDLGSQVCTTANINCQKCPLNQGCKAFKQNKQADYPEKKAKKAKPRKETTLLIILNSQNQILLEKRPPMGIWGGLWSLPEINQKQNITAWFEQHYPFCKAQFLAKLDSRPHTFTHFHLEIKPQIWLINEAKQDQVKEDQTIWYDFNQPIKKGLAKPVSQILSEIKRWNKNDSKSSRVCAIEKTS